MTEFNLTEKITHLDYDEPHLQVKDVVEFIRLLKEELSGDGSYMVYGIHWTIDKLAGPELTQTPSGGSPQGDLLGKSNLSLRPADAHTQHKGDYARGINKIMHKDTQTQDEKTCANKGAKD